MKICLLTSARSLFNWVLNSLHQPLQAVYYPRNERLFSVVLSYPINSTLTWFSSVFAPSYAAIHRIESQCRCFSTAEFSALESRRSILSNVTPALYCQWIPPFVPSDQMPLSGERNFALSCFFLVPPQGKIACAFLILPNYFIGKLIF